MNAVNTQRDPPDGGEHSTRDSVLNVSEANSQQLGNLILNRLRKTRIIAQIRNNKQKKTSSH